MECLHSIGEELSGRFDVPTRVQGIDPLKSTKKDIHCIFVCSSAGMADGSVVIFVIIVIYFVVTIRDDVQSLVCFPSLKQDFDSRLQ